MQFCMSHISTKLEKNNKRNLFQKKKEDHWWKIFCVFGLRWAILVLFQVHQCGTERKKVKLLSRVQLFAIPWTVATRFLPPWDSPGKNTGVGCHFFLQGIFLTRGSNPGLPHCRQMLYPLSHEGSSLADSRHVNYPDGRCWEGLMRADYFIIIPEKKCSILQPKSKSIFLVNN